MEQLNYPVLFVLALLVVALIAWVIYRNFKDEKKFERDMDDPHRKTDIHHDRDKT